jgi:hypothetical protein
MGRVAILFLAGVLALRGQVAAFDAAGKALHVAVDVPTKNHQLLQSEATSSFLIIALIDSA